jgi:hypothetical protein
MTDLVQIRCVICERVFDQLEGAHPDNPMGGTVITFDAYFAGATATRGLRELRAYLCEECIYEKGLKGLVHLVKTTIQHEYQVWKPRMS